MPEKPDQPARVSFFKDLISRRVPQILGGYLAASWILLEFMDWLVRRYPISPHLVEFCLVFLAAMIPTIFLLAYFHGKPGRDQWTKIEKIGIPTNLVVTTLLLVFLFRGKEIGATTTSISVTDEKGQQIERLIPKSAFRKKVAIFSFENETGDTTIGWMMHAIPDMIRYDLSQNMYLTVKTIYEFYNDVRDEGYPEAIGIPLIIKKKITEGQYMDYFIEGNIYKEENKFNIHLSLHDTKTTKKIDENAFTGDDVLTMVDDLSLWIRKGLSIPEQHVEQTTDLPASEILTNNVPALKTLYQGYTKCVLLNDWENGLDLLNRSIQYDTTFAYAYGVVSKYNLNNNRTEEGVQAIQSLMMYRHKLPERMQYKITYAYYAAVKQDMEMAMEVAKTFAGLYPDDIEAYELLASQYQIRNEKDKEIETYKRILQIDPGQSDYLRAIGAVYRDQGMLDEARDYLQEYADEFPGNAESYGTLGYLHLFYFGEPELAKNYFKQALAIGPDEISSLLGLAKADVELGNFKKGLDSYYEILKNCTTPRERFNVYFALENYYFLRGELNKAIEYFDLKLAEQEKYDDQFEIFWTKSGFIPRYIIAGKSDAAFELVQYAEEHFGPPQDYMIPQIKLSFYLELEQLEGIENNLKDLEEYIDILHMEANRFLTHLARGKIHELKGEYESAVQEYLDYIELLPVVPSMHFHIGHCYRKLKNYRKAEEHLLKVMEFGPYWPEEVFELGLVYADWGKKDQALEYLRRANYIWENADTTYALAMRAREKLAELEK